LVLCAGIELDSAMAPLCAAAQGDAGRNYPTFSLALAALPNPHWSAVAPSGPLRRWRLLDLGSGPVVTVAPLRIDERVLHYLTGVSYWDERLAAMIEPIVPAAATDLAPSQNLVVRGIAAAWSGTAGRGPPPVIQLQAADLNDCRPIAAAAAGALGLHAAVLPSELVPAPAAEFDALLRLWEREAALSRSALLVECDGEGAGSADEVRCRAGTRFAERVGGLILISSREPVRILHRPSLQFQVSRPSTAEQQSAWRSALDPEALTVSPAIGGIACQFSLGYPAIRALAAEARYTAASGRDLAEAAWQVCCARCRARLDGLAQRIEPAAGWDDLVLPEEQTQVLGQIAMQVRHRATVYESWGFATKSARGLGISALFAGASGTGKTMAAEVLAKELRLDLYRIDLASVVSKYIGETEKNLRRVFDAAEESGAILLFDEADALFGKRSEVKDSHDRYANIEVSYLLQRMEQYRGLAILTTNLKQALDPAFLRRIRFIVQFPFPDAAQRAEIWRRIFPAPTPTQGLALHKLARLNLAGGNIRNIAINAAFLAADAGEKVRMVHLLRAARREFVKLAQPLTESEIRDWVNE
jgi:hypothetical protein